MKKTTKQEYLQMAKTVQALTERQRLEFEEAIEAAKAEQEEAEREGWAPMTTGETLKALVQAAQDGDASKEAELANFLESINEDLRGEAEDLIATLKDALDAEDKLQLFIALRKYKLKESGQNVINNSNVVKQLVRREAGEIKLGINPETGEQAIFTLLAGYLTPYEKEIVECVSKFKLDGQLTEKGKIYFTLGQLYRAMRHGAGTLSPLKDQKEALLKALIDLSNDERKLTFKLNNYLKVWGGFETNGGRLRILGFDELYGRIRGQEETLIILDDTPIVCAVADNLHHREIIPQEVKAVRQHKYLLTLNEPIEINGKPVKSRGFATNEERRKFCKKYGVKASDISDSSEEAKPWKLTENRIALRSVILDFVYSYIRARAADQLHSNKKNYGEIFTLCNIGKDNKQQSRAKADIAVILDHLKATIPELKGWAEYSNKGSKKPDGVQVFLQLPESEG